MFGQHNFARVAESSVPVDQHYSPLPFMADSLGSVFPILQLPAELIADIAVLANCEFTASLPLMSIHNEGVSRER